MSSFSQIMSCLWNFLAGESFCRVLLWWAWMLAAGLVFFPIARKFFGGFLDRGYALGKVLALAIPAYLVFLAGTIHAAKFTRAAVMASFVPILAASIYLLWRNRGEFSIRRRMWRWIVAEEFLTLLGLTAWSFVRSLQPEIENLEKFMDYGFMNSALHSDYFPPPDMWFAGASINYYYFGQYFAAFLVRLTQVPPGVGYNLMIATTFALALTLAFAAGANLTAFAAPARRKSAMAAGLISAAMLTCGGNLHTFIYGVALPAMKARGFYSGELKDYRFSDSTRYIGYNPPTNDKTISEFPSYSFVVSDLHAHLVNLLFVLAMVLVVMHLFCSRRPEEAPGPKRPWFAEPAIGFMAFLLGLCMMTNSWDFPIYALLAGAAIFLINLRESDTLRSAVRRTLAQGAVLVAGAFAVAMPFLLTFRKFSGGLHLSKAHSPLYQLLVLHGYQWTLIALFVAALVRQVWHTARDLSGSKRQRFKAALGGLGAADVLALVMFCEAVLLVLLPEVFFIKDIYHDGYKRANTMFKFGYQSYVLLTTAAGYAAVRLVLSHRGLGTRLASAGGMLVLLGLPLLFMPFALAQYYSLPDDSAVTLDGTAFLDKRHPDDAVIIQWLEKNEPGRVNILEGAGKSYTFADRVSVFTGLPTPAGWETHEQLWRGSFKAIQQRQQEVAEVYEGGDVEKAREILSRYDVRYIVVGIQEQKLYPDLNQEKLLELGQSYKVQGSSMIIRVAPSK